MTWKFTIQSGGSRITIDTHLHSYEDALAMVTRLYGDDVVIVSQETQ